jgi:hypothetical protein
MCFPEMREKMKKKKEIIIDDELKAKKKHMSFGQVGTVKRISSPP